MKVDFKRVGGYSPAEKDSHAREYDDKGNYTMTGKQLREKGKMYWTNWEVTGHVDSAGGVPKFSLLKHFRDSLIPALEEKARKYNCIVKFQFDGAGPHNDKELLKFLRDEFAKRGWIFKFQPSQCPILNVSDACIFPSLSKTVSSNQAIQFDGNRKILQGDAIWNAASDAWNEMPLSTIARSYTGHAQIATAVIEFAGDIAAFTRGAGCLHNGVRKTYVSTHEGVVILEAAIPTELDSKHLRYLSPKLADLGGEQAVFRLQSDERLALGVTTTTAIDGEGGVVKVNIIANGISKN